MQVTPTIFTKLQEIDTNIIPYIIYGLQNMFREVK